jgi:ABC-type glutathione transport system ATPase component
LVGESGAGKTTFLQSLLGHYIPGNNKENLLQNDHHSNEIAPVGKYHIESETGDVMVISHTYLQF